MLSGSVNFVRAQSVSPYVGAGSAKDSAGTTNNSTTVCPTRQIFDGVICQAGPTMGGLFGLFGVDFMFKKHLGINGEYTFHVKRASYLPSDGLTMRPSFYDVNALWQPFSGKRYVPYFEGGFGGARVALNFNQAAAVPGFSPSSLPTGTNPSYFQLHGAVGLKVYVHGNLFIRGPLDLHYVLHLKNEFGRDLVLQFAGAVGYTFGGH